jgi:hypothetical protein
MPVHLRRNACTNLIEVSRMSVITPMLRRGYEFCREMLEGGSELPSFALVEREGVDLLWIEQGESIEDFRLRIGALDVVASAVFASARSEGRDMLICIVRQSATDSHVLTNEILERSPKLQLSRTQVFPGESFRFAE